MEINNASQYKKGEDCIIIQFTIDTHPYYLVVRRNGSDEFFPFSVRHDSDERCEYCQKRNAKWDECSDLYSRRETIFYRLINFPSIRLEWLYLPYEENRKGSAQKWNPDLSKN